MPKIVDHEARRGEIAHALWQVLRRDGVAAASVRSVAAEAGISPGAMRHYFSSQSELLVFAMQAVQDLMSPLVLERFSAAGSADDLVHTMLATLPTTEDLRLGCEVWLSLVVAARTDASLRPVALAAHQVLARLYRDILEALTAMEGHDTAIDLDAEAPRLHALVDGLAVHGTLYPDQVSVEDMTGILQRHLATLRS